MEFNSLEYLLLLLVASLLFFGAGYRARLIILIAASLVFYAAWNVPLVSLIVISAVIDYTAGRLLGRDDGGDGEDRSRRRKLILAVSLAVNLGLLGYFKYANFFLENLHELFGLGDEGTWLDVVLPPGISFYTFQTMSYTIDVYRRKLRPTTSFLRFFLYVSFFPQLIAGPIERAGHLLVQFDQAATRPFRVQNLVSGGQMIVWGVFKKAVIADHCGLLCDQIYQNPGAYDGWSALIATYAFTLQIYCDFSAYSEIARGSARIFGVDLMVNFDQPYLTTNIGAFWRRWHISLSNWFRDYVYIPLGGNKLGKRRTLVNLTVTMFLSGLWHGAAWTFVVWGLFHGVLLLINAQLGDRFAKLLPTGRAAWVGTLIAWFVNFHLVVIGWILFRAADMRQFGEITLGIGKDLALAVVGFGHGPSAEQALFILFTFGFVLASYFDRKHALIERVWSSPTAASVFASALIVATLLLGLSEGPAFIYFQF
ncbi:putative poly(beta-D-mannuronate) O-acetylase [Enhygromyxa salina]|uniref:Putative poly(Beta-D-mannuronate) O-acetylase n=1 Tax=Enhygromyxa salina TaxID=215803 RepID=A0A0C1ZS37_9BACT|nr:MBOAT family O-acyltransferase [Enhygromyxa salina]KIG13888.1 putative poly(beta-D-mannuronate) O-acetylase [Enhygromyxa salina]